MKENLLRKLDLWSIIAIGVGAIIGGGIFTLTGFAAGLAGPGLIFVMLLNGFFAFLTVLASAELSSAIPDAGGGYLWVKKGLGFLPGHMSGWISWLAHSVACGVYALSFGFYLVLFLNSLVFPALGLEPLNPDFWQKFITFITVILMSIVNLFGVSGFGKWTKTIVGLEVSVILVFIVFGFISFFVKPAMVNNFEVIFPYGISGLFSSMGLMYLAFQGSEVISQSSEEVKNQKDIQKAMFVSFEIIMALYILVAFAAILGIKGEIPSWQILSRGNEGALIEGAKYFILSKWIVPIVIAGGVLAALAALLTTIYSSSHVFYAMAHNKSLPAWLGKPHKKYKTPHIGIIASTILILILIFLLPIKDVAAIADMMFILIFSGVHLSLINLRKTSDSSPSFRTPFYPIGSILTLIFYGIIFFYLTKLSPWGVSVSLLWILLGFIIYALYAKPKETEDVQSGLIAGREEDFGYETKCRILLPILPQTKWEDILPYVVALAKGKSGRVWISNIVEFPASIPMRFLNGERKNLDALHSRLSEEFAKNKISYRIFSQKTRNASQEILDIVKQQDSDLLILPKEQFAYQKRGFFGESFNKVLRETHCDLLIIKAANFKIPAKILLPLSPNPNNKMIGGALESLVASFGSSITVIHSCSPHTDAEVKKVEEAKLEELIQECKIPAAETKKIVKSDVHQMILSELKDYDLLVMAGGRETPFGKIVFSSTAEKIMEEANSDKTLSAKTIIVGHHHQALLEPVVSSLWKWLSKLFKKNK